MRSVDILFFTVTNKSCLCFSEVVIAATLDECVGRHFVVVSTV